jgi:putative hydrolase of the HAD superfamily
MTSNQPPTSGDEIRALIFDYGGVLWDMRWDVTRALEQQHQLRERAIVETLYSGERWQKLEVGVGDREEWLAAAHAELEAQAGRPLPRLHDDWRGQQHLIAPNIELIRRLRPKYRTSVLSNADNTLMARLRDHHRIAHLFDDIVCSADIGMAKPEPRIYAIAAERLSLAPGECVFIDDLERNVDAAHQAGMHGILFRHDLGHSLEAQLGELGVHADANAQHRDSQT